MKIRSILANRTMRVAFSVGLKIAGSGIAFLWQWLVFRLLGASIGGMVMVGQSQMRVIGTLGNLGRDRSLSFEVANLSHCSDIRTLLNNRQIESLILTFIFLLVSTSFFVMQGGMEIYFIDYVLIWGGALTFSLLMNYAGAARGIDRALSADIGFTILPLLVSTIIFLGTRQLPLGVFRLSLIAIIAGQMLSCIWLASVIHQRAKAFPDGERRREAVRVFSFEQFRVAVSANLSAMYPDILIIVIGYAASTSSAAAFGIAVRYIRLARFVPVSFLHVREPSLAKLWKSGAKSEVASEVAGMASGSFGVSIAILTVLFAFPELFLGLFSQELAGQVLVFRFVIAAELVNSTSLMQPSLLILSNNTKILSLLLMLTYGFGVISSCFIISLYGGVGAAVVLFLTNIALSIFVTISCRNRTGIRADALSSIAYYCARWSRKITSFMARA